ncbi:factor activating pos9, partial [Tulasnella sp. 331]
MSETNIRQIPNVVITGTPGTGKSSHAQHLVETCSLPLRHVNIGELVKEKRLYESYDSEWESYVVDDDKASPAYRKVLDEIEPMTEEGGLILDWHTCDTFPERWVDLVVVLRCDHTVLWDRLEKRGYPLKKIQENNESEIMQTVLEDAKESYNEEIVVELKSEGIEDLESN